MSMFVIHDKNRETYKKNSSKRRIRNYGNKKYSKNTSEKKLQQGREKKRDEEWTCILLKKRYKILAVRVTRKGKENNNVIDIRTEYKVSASESKRCYKDSKIFQNKKFRKMR